MHLSSSQLLQFVALWYVLLIGEDSKPRVKCRCHSGTHQSGNEQSLHVLHRWCCFKTCKVQPRGYMYISPSTLQSMVQSQQLPSTGQFEEMQVRTYECQGADRLWIEFFSRSGRAFVLAMTLLYLCSILYCGQVYQEFMNKPSDLRNCLTTLIANM